MAMKKAKAEDDLEVAESIDFDGILQTALDEATKEFTPGEAGLPKTSLSPKMIASLTELSQKAGASSSAFTNIVTCLTIKVAKPTVDIRYHQTQIQGLTTRPAGFNFRTPSEKKIYPWLSSHDFQGAKSGWQTRTMERPKPYDLNYDENIQHVKGPFLWVFNEIEVLGASAEEALKVLIHLQLQFRETQRISLAVPVIDDISEIVKLFQRHFFKQYAARGASRLPVLAFHAIYQALVNELARYSGMTLRDLEEHSAADSQTGAIGDIEVANARGEVFEALEIKHDIEITSAILESAKRKIMTAHPNRYYLLTTHGNCDASSLQGELRVIQVRFGCQVIVNGVIPSLRYYLRLLSTPSVVLKNYVDALKSEGAIAHEHREAWNEIALSCSVEDLAT